MTLISYLSVLPSFRRPFFPSSLPPRVQCSPALLLSFPRAYRRTDVTGAGSITLSHPFTSLISVLSEPHQGLEAAPHTAAGGAGRDWADWRGRVETRGALVLRQDSGAVRASPSPARWKSKQKVMHENYTAS